MLGKTHKAFGVTCVAITAIAYYQFTRNHITQDVVYELNQNPTPEIIKHIHQNANEYTSWLNPLLQ